MLRPEMVMTGCMDVLMKTERGQEVNYGLMTIP